MLSFLRSLARSAVAQVALGTCSSRRRRQDRLRLEPLEDRALLATFTVTHTEDAGEGSLRQAILDANSSLGTDAIHFAIDSGVQTIRPVSALPAITDPVLLDGTTQPGFSGNPLIVLNGTLVAGQANGIVITAGSSSLRGLVVNGWRGNGIVLEGAGDNVITGNFVGTDSTGTQALPNGIQGILVQASSNNRIGGATSSERNVLSGNGSRNLTILGSTSPSGGSVANNVIEGNYIGTDLTGTRALGGGVGIALLFTGTAPIIVGGSGAGVGNLISGQGVGVELTSSRNILIEGNYIGTNALGTAAVPNNVGIRTSSGSIGNRIVRNLISGNIQEGIAAGEEETLVQGNTIGTDFSGSRVLGNAVGVALGNGRNSLVIGNLISGNTIGISGSGLGTRVQGNFVGTNRAGTAAVANGTGIQGVRGLIGGTSSQERNLISGNTVAGIVASSDSTIQGNYIGTDITGLRALGNGTGISLPLLGSSPAPIIGGTTQGAGNLISGNRADGIAGRGERVRIEGNRIGTNALGSAVLGNGGSGISFSYAEAAVIGGPGTASNLISGNAQNGIALREASSFTRIQGNLIGTNATGNSPLWNEGQGILVQSSIGSVTNLIGGAGPGQGNTISGNRQGGIRLEGAAAGRFQIQGNSIGTDVTGTFALANLRYGISVAGGVGIVLGGTEALAGNLISGNTGPGVQLLAGSTTLLHNRIGTDVQGVRAIRNEIGVQVLAGSNRNIIGSPSAGNLISGNGFQGMILMSIENTVQGNRIGTNLTGTLPLGNGASAGITLEGNNNLIGGTASGAGNVVSGNAEGIRVTGAENRIQGNRIGTDSTGSQFLGNTGSGIVLTGSRNVVGGISAGEGNLISGNQGGGITVGGAGNQVQGNRIGTDVSGTLSLGNQQAGVILSGASDALVGGLVLGAGNLISGNQGDGLLLLAVSGIKVEGNVIGLDASVSMPVPNTGNGIRSVGWSNSTIGAPSGGINVISGNHLAGIRVTFSPSQGLNWIQNNFIGTDGTGSSALGNLDGIRFEGQTRDVLVSNNLVSGNQRDGIVLSERSSENRLTDNLIGTDRSGSFSLGNGGHGVYLNGAEVRDNVIEYNQISFNAFSGVLVDAGIGNAIRANSIFGNGGLGIDLQNGGNKNQSAPRLLLAVELEGMLFLVGRLQSSPNTTFTVEFFANDECDPSRIGEGQTYLGSIQVTTDATGEATFLAMFTLPLGRYFSATATDPEGNTSGFSGCVELDG